MLFTLASQRLCESHYCSYWALESRGRVLSFYPSKEERTLGTLQIIWPMRLKYEWAVKVEDRKYDENSVKGYENELRKIWVKWCVKKLQNLKMISEESQRIHAKNVKPGERMTKKTEDCRGWSLTKLVFDQVTELFKDLCFMERQMTWNWSKDLISEVTTGCLIKLEFSFFSKRID